MTPCCISCALRIEVERRNDEGVVGFCACRVEGFPNRETCNGFVTDVGIVDAVEEEKP